MPRKPSGGPLANRRSVLALDPGCAKTGWLVYDGVKPVDWGLSENKDLLHAIRQPNFHAPATLVIESVDHYGMAVGREVFETVFWSGRFAEARDDEFHRLSRGDVKLALCGTRTARDANVRQALIDRFGGESVAIGGRRCKVCHGSGLRGRGKARKGCQDCGGLGGEPKGPLYGISSHVWSALALAVVFDARKGKQ